MRTLLRVFCLNILCGTLPLLNGAIPLSQAEQGSHGGYLSLSLEQALNVEVVTVSKRKQTISNAPSIVSVFSRSDIEKIGAQTLVDILKYAPGIEVSMAANGEYRVAIRGVRKEGNILLLIDGQRVGDFYDGSVIFDLPTDFIDQIELIRGPGSALYGTSAVVGVINVRSIRAEQNKLRLRAGNNDALGVSGQYGTSFGAESKISINAGYQQGNGDEADITVNNSSNIDGLTLPTQRTLEEGYVQISMLNDGWELSSFVLHRQRGPWIGDEFDHGPESEYQHSQLSAHLFKIFSLQEDWQFKPQLSLDYLDKDDLKQTHPAGYIASGNIFPEGTQTREDYRALSMDLDAQFDYSPAPDKRLLMGFVYQQQELLDYGLTRNFTAASNQPQPGFDNYDNVELAQDGETRTIQAAYFQGQFDWQPLSLTAGFRYDDYDDFGSNLSPRLGLVYSYSEQLSFKWLLADAFRAPTLQELYDNTRVGATGTRSNPNLNPETIRTVELGAEYRLRQSLVRANVFYNETEDIIGVFDPFGGGARGDIENLGNTESFGGEIEVTSVLSDHYTLTANYAQFRRDFEWSNSATFDGSCCRDFINSDGEAELVNSPRIRANLSLNFEFNQFSGFVGLNYGGKSGPNARSVIEFQSAFSGDSVVIDEYVQGDFRLSYRFSNSSSLHFTGTNLGPDKYSDPDASTAMGAFGSQGLVQPCDIYTLTWETGW